ncbi:MAG: hypothetical protein KDA22_01145 [Phycisphaerales bacterium]|nr:hypothetical protein [Phycisphaerales bacterium]
MMHAVLTGAVSMVLLVAPRSTTAGAGDESAPPTGTSVQELFVTPWTEMEIAGVNGLGQRHLSEFSQFRPALGEDAFNSTLDHLVPALTPETRIALGDAFHGYLLRLDSEYRAEATTLWNRSQAVAEECSASGMSQKAIDLHLAKVAQIVGYDQDAEIATAALLDQVLATRPAEAGGVDNYDLVVARVLDAFALRRRLAGVTSDAGVNFSPITEMPPTGDIEMDAALGAVAISYLKDVAPLRRQLAAATAKRHACSEFLRTNDEAIFLKAQRLQSSPEARRLILEIRDRTAQAIHEFGLLLGGPAEEALTAAFDQASFPSVYPDPLRGLELCRAIAAPVDQPWEADRARVDAVAADRCAAIQRNDAELRNREMEYRLLQASGGGQADWDRMSSAQLDVKRLLSEREALVSQLREELAHVIGVPAVAALARGSTSNSH